MVLSERHLRYIRYALKRANDAPLNQKQRLGCVIVKRGAPLSSGSNNMEKTHPRASRYAYPYLHAELDALIGVDEEDLRGSIAYVARKRRIGTPGLAKPCEYCMEEMRRVGIKGVFYTLDNGGIDFIDLRQNLH